MPINSLKEYTPARNAYINARLGPNPMDMRLDSVAGPSYDPAQEAAYLDWKRQYDALQGQFNQTLDPADWQAIQEEKVRSAAKDQSRFTRGANIVKLGIGGIAAAGLGPILAAEFGAAGGGAAAEGLVGYDAAMADLAASGGLTAGDFAGSVAATGVAPTAAELADMQELFQLNPAAGPSAAELAAMQELFRTNPPPGLLDELSNLRPPPGASQGLKTAGNLLEDPAPGAGGGGGGGGGGFSGGGTGYAPRPLTPGLQLTPSQGLSGLAQNWRRRPRGLLD